MPAKLADSWWLVLLRGLLEGSLLAPFFIADLQELGPLLLFVGAVLVAGSLIEFWMALRLPGHPFRGILIFVAISGLACGAFLLFHHPGTLMLLLVIVGLWLAIRGFASLWLGLSIVSGVFDRVVPVLAGLIGLLGGGAVMIWFPVDIDLLTALLLAYGAAAGALHFILTWRLWWEQRRKIKEAVSQQP